MACNVQFFMPTTKVTMSRQLIKYKLLISVIFVLLDHAEIILHTHTIFASE